MPEDIRFDETSRFSDVHEKETEQADKGNLSAQLQTNGKEHNDLFENIKETAEKYLPDLSFVSSNPAYEIGKSIARSGILFPNFSGLEDLLAGAGKNKDVETNGKALERAMSGIAGRALAGSAEIGRSVGEERIFPAEKQIIIDKNGRIQTVDTISPALSDKEINQAKLKLKEYAEQQMANEEEKLKEEGKAWNASPEQINKRLADNNRELDASKKVAEMILKGDIESLQQLVKAKDGNPANLKRVAEMLKAAGFELIIEKDRHGRLLISHPGDERAVMIDANGRADIIGIKDGKYDFEAEYVNANPEQELQVMMIRAQDRPKFEPLRVLFKDYQTSSKPDKLPSSWAEAERIEATTLHYKSSDTNGKIEERRPVENRNAIYANPQE